MRAEILRSIKQGSCLLGGSLLIGVSGGWLNPAATARRHHSTHPRTYASSVAGANTRMGKYPLVVAGGNPPSAPENFNPFSPNARSGWAFIYEPLYVINDLTGQQIPWLAQSFKWINPQKVQFTLRQGVKWSNGAPLTAMDVVFTFNLMKRYPAIDANAVWSFLKSVSSQGNVVTFQFSRVDYPALGFLQSQPIVYPPQFLHVNPTKFTDVHPIGTGPYTVQSFSPDQYSLTVNRLYWQRDKIFVPKITIVSAVGNSIDDLELSQGKFDWGQYFEPAIYKSYVAKNPKSYHYWFPTAAPVSLYLNLSEKPFSQVKFRQAMAYGINRQAIYKKGEYGYEKPANQSLLASGLNRAWLDQSLARKYAYPYAPAKAAALLASMGYHKKNGKLMGPTGTQLAFTLEVPSGYTDWIQDCQIIQEDLGRLGIKVTVETPSVSTYASDLSTGHFQAALNQINMPASPYYNYDYQLASSESAPIGQAAPSNDERWNNAQTNQLIKQLGLTNNVAREHQIVDQLQKIAFTKVPLVALVYGATFFEYQTNHYVGWPTAKNPYWDPAEYVPSDALVVITRLKPAR